MNSLFNNDMVVHNFCESRINHYNPPEIVNAYTSMFITFIPIFFGFPQDYYFFNIAILFLLNGFASFYYHYYLNYIGKQMDEICMILINYYCILGLMNVYNNKLVIQKYIYYNRLFALSFILFNSIQSFDFFFPFLFGAYVLPSLYFIHQIYRKYDYHYYSMLISFWGFGCWVLSETYCNEYTYLGHTVWHVAFPLGIYKLILSYDKQHFGLIY
jgi:hypothetical protein